jgi:hypothetical protein
MLGKKLLDDNNEMAKTSSYQDEEKLKLLLSQGPKKQLGY